MIQCFALPSVKVIFVHVSNLWERKVYFEGSFISSESVSEAMSL